MILQSMEWSKSPLFISLLPGCCWRGSIYITGTERNLRVEIPSKTVVNRTGVPLYYWFSDGCNNGFHNNYQDNQGSFTQM